MKRLVLFLFLLGILLLTLVRSTSAPGQEVITTPILVRSTPTGRAPAVKPATVSAPTQTRLPEAGEKYSVALPTRAVDIPTATVTPVDRWRYHPPGEIKAPILLYHHIGEYPTRPAAEAYQRYFVSRPDFEAQMSRLQEWGYTSIPLSLLVQAIVEGAELPPKPVVITFDDGYRDVYLEALPVMQKYGFSGTLYVIQDQVGIKGYMSANQINQLIENGWEIGSHSKTHADLRKSVVNLAAEVVDSRLALEVLFSTPVRSFSYPYGSATPSLKEYVQKAGYLSAVGVGTSLKHSAGTRYYLSRLEVRGTYDLDDFARLLLGGVPR